MAKPAIECKKLWFVMYADEEPGYDAKAFTTEKDACHWAEENVSRHRAYIIYEGNQQWRIYVKEPALEKVLYES